MFNRLFLAVAAVLVVSYRSCLSDEGKPGRLTSKLTQSKSDDASDTDHADRSSEEARKANRMPEPQADFVSVELEPERAAPADRDSTKSKPTDTVSSDMESRNSDPNQEPEAESQSPQAWPTDTRSDVSDAQPCPEDGDATAAGPAQADETHSTSTGRDVPASNSMAVVAYDESSLPIFHRDGRDFTFGAHTIHIKQNWREMGVAAVVWDAAVVLGEYLYGQPGLIQKRRVIELGAGTGLVGILAALLGAKVTITDRKSALNSLRDNVHLKMSSQSCGEQPCAIEVKELEWGHDLENFPQPYDMVLGADIIYIEETFPQLLETLVHLSDCNTIVLLSCKVRYERDTRFIDMLKDLFVVDEVFYDKERDIHVHAARKKC